MKKRQNETKQRQALSGGERALLGLTALFLCALMILRGRGGVTVRALPSGVDAAAGETGAAAGGASSAGAGGAEAAERTAGGTANAGANGADAAERTADGAANAGANGADAAERTAGGADPGTANPGGRSLSIPPVDINTADEDTLAALPGIGPVLAGRITAYRAEHGPFASVEDLTSVSGIGAAKLAAVREYITAGG